MLAQEFCHSGGSTLQEFRQRLSKNSHCQSCVYIFSKSMGNESASFNSIVQVTNFNSAYTLRNRKAQPLRWRNVEHDDVYRVGRLGDCLVTLMSPAPGKNIKLSAKAVSQDKKNLPNSQSPNSTLYRPPQNCLKIFQTHAKVSIPTCTSCFNDVHQGLSRLNCIIGICMVDIQLGPCHGTRKMRDVRKMVDVLIDISIFCVLKKMDLQSILLKETANPSRSGVIPL